MIMKKIILASILAVAAMGYYGCKKESYVAKFDKLPQERMADQINLVKTTLTGAENGWIATLPTLSGGGYAFYLQFDEEGFVNMYGDLTDETSGEPKKSEYRVRQDMGAALTFGTYTYISILNNPDPSAFGSPDIGDGFKSDIDFIYDHATDDSIVFIGKRYRQLFSLIKATAAQKDQYTKGNYTLAVNNFKQYMLDNPNLYYEDGDMKVAVEANSGNSMTAGKRITFTAMYGNDSIVANTEKFAYTIDQMAILNGGLAFNKDTFVSIRWKDAHTLALYDKAGNEKVLKNNPVPLLPLYKLWGTKYAGMASAYQQINPGTSQKGADILNYFHNNLCGTGVLDYCFNYGAILFLWDVVNHRLAMAGFVSQNGGGSGWNSTVVYNYSVDDNGVYTFSIYDDLRDGYCQNAMIPLYQFMLNNRVKFDYYLDGADVYAQMSSVDDPSVVMTFVLQ